MARDNLALRTKSTTVTASLAWLPWCFCRRGQLITGKRGCS